MLDVIVSEEGEGERLESQEEGSEESKWREKRVSRKIAGILFSEYEPLKIKLLLLITRYLPINPRPGHSWCKSASILGPAKKPNRALIHEIEGNHFDLLTGRDRFSCRGPGTGSNYKKRVNGTRSSVRKFQPRKRAHLFRFSTFSGNFPEGRTDETCSIYRRTGNSGNFDKMESAHCYRLGL